VNGAILLITALISTQKFTHRRVNITLKIDVTNAILSRDFVAQVRDFIAHALIVELHAATLSHKLINTASAPLFPFQDPTSQTLFQNDEIVPYLVFSYELFD